MPTILNWLHNSVLLWLPTGADQQEGKRVVLAPNERYTPTGEFWKAFFFQVTRQGGFEELFPPISFDGLQKEGREMVLTVGFVNMKRRNRDEKRSLLKGLDEWLDK